MGSGAFLVQACRYLGARLVESWEIALTCGDQITRPRALKLGFVIDRSQVFRVVMPEQMGKSIDKLILQFCSVESERRCAEVKRRSLRRGLQRVHQQYIVSRFQDYGLLRSE